MRKVLHPLVSAEIDDFDLVKAVNNGMIPRHYMVNNPWERLRAYVGVYLEEEIRDESISRRLKSFTRFLESAAFTNGEMVVYKNIAQDCGIDHRTVKDYFTILSDSMIGYLIHGFADICSSASRQLLVVSCSPEPKAPRSMIRLR